MTMRVDDSLNSNQNISTYFIDELTLLGNRRCLKDCLSEYETHTNSILIYIDINDFGTINEAYGEEFGNQVLRKFAINLAINFCNFKAFRVEADIFGLLKTDDCDKLSNEIIRLMIDDFLLNPIIIDNEIIDLFATAILVRDKEMLIKKAEVTLRFAKKQKKEFLIHSEDINNISRESHIKYRTLSQQIRVAIKEKKIFPVYQPIYSNREKKITKYESLARLKLNNNEVLAPDKFLDIAKRINKYADITKIMVEKTLTFFNHKDIGISLNISLEDIVNEDVVDFIIEHLEKFKKPSNITFEILEDSSIAILKKAKSVAFTDNEKCVDRFITKVKEFGCSIAIDDFGSGYSNFVNISALSPNIIKIDGSLVRNLDDLKVKLMAELFIDYAKKIGCEVVAEFVEDKETQLKVVAMGVEYSQGYYIGKPNENLIEEDLK